MEEDSWRTIRERSRECGLERCIEIELRCRDELRNVVVVVLTDDNLLTESIVNLGSVLVLASNRWRARFNFNML